ncbi:MAG: hypothetical protein U9N45_00020, partial [Gemmatimonadota bacterium]|nr:hypothetical protein [Gemmatimonadota bacterium]
MSLLELLIAGVMKLAGGQMFPVLVPRAQRLSQIRKGFAESGGQYIVPVLMVTAVLLAASMVFVILNSHREKARLRDQEKKYFRHRMIEKELEPGHIRMLSDAVSITGFLRPDRVLDSFETFKHLIAEYEKAQTLSKQEHDYLMKTVNEI